MSFRWNLSQPNQTQRSFVTLGNELIATSIGLTANRTTVSCRMNCHLHDYKYCKTQDEILASLAILETKLKRQSFRQIQKYTHYHREYTSSVFLPDALSHGNYSALSKFLQNLRTNRVNAYVKLNLQQSKGYFHKAATLLKPVASLLKQRVQYGFVRLKRNMVERREAKKILILQEISSIQNKQSLNSENEEVNSTQNVVRISYIKVNLNPERGNTSNNQKSYTSNSNNQKSSTSRQFSTTKKTSQSREGLPCLDLSQLIVPNKVKHYQFNNINLTKLHSQRLHSTAQK